MSIRVKLDDVLKYEQPTNYIVETTNYNDIFPIPVLTAGKSFILGYTDEIKGVYSEIPVIIFDDFTTAFHYVDFPFKVKSSAMKILKPVKEKADLRYLFYKMHTISLDTDLHKRYWISKYSQLQISLPPLEQQKKIASILDAADAYRQKTKALIAKYDELTQSLFLDMFGDPVKNEKGWEVKKIIDLVSSQRPITYGILMPKENIKPLGIPYIKVVDVKNGEILKDQICHTTEEIEKNYIRSRLLENDILFSIRGHVGRICIVPKDLEGSNITQDTARLDVKDFLSPEFAESCFNSIGFQRYMSKYVKGAGVKGINLGDLKNLKIIVPPRMEQNHYSLMIKELKKQKAQAQASLEKAEELFNSLLQRAFKGELV